MKALRDIGLRALPALRQALKSSPSLEVRRRVEVLVRELEDHELLARLVAPQRVRLNVKDATVAEAVAQRPNKAARQYTWPRRTHAAASG